jgi:hypothetical protein
VVQAQFYTRTASMNVPDIPALARIISVLDAASGPGTPIPPTLLYNENWLMRLVLSIANEGVPCLPFALEPHARWFSEARLPTRFNARGQSDKKGEPATHADGVVGHFSFATDTKASLELNPDGSQFVVLEGKMFSKLRKDVKNAEDYDQVARNIGCMAESLCRSGKPPDQWKSLGFYLFAPQSQIDRGIFSGAMERDSVRKAIRGRINSYECEYPNEIQQWESLWFEPLVARMKPTCVSWEKIIEDIKRHDSETGSQIEKFYSRTLEFNRAKKPTAGGPNKGKGLRQPSFVYIPQITKEDRTVLHLSVRGDSYRLRRYDLRARTKKPRGCTLPECATIQELRASSSIVKEFSVTKADMRHSLDNEPEYWCKRIEEVNAECFTTEDAPPR